MVIDAKGKACPIPFMLAKECIDKQEQFFIVDVDNPTAVENLKKLAKTYHYITQVEQIEHSHFSVSFTQEGHEVQTPALPSSACEWALFIGKDYMGEGDAILGRNLIKMFLYTIEKQESLPNHILLMNRGIFLSFDDAQIVQTLTSLQKRGVEILVCGTCLDYYHATESLRVGTIGNMYDIAKILSESPKVLTI